MWGAVAATAWLDMVSSVNQWSFFNPKILVDVQFLSLAPPPAGSSAGKQGSTQGVSPNPMRRKQRATEVSMESIVASAICRSSPP